MSRRWAWRASAIPSLLLWCASNVLAQPRAPSDPTSAEAHFQLGVTYERQKDFAAAAASYARAIDAAPRMAEAHDRLGFVLGQQGQTAKAISEFEEAVRLNPRLFDAQYHLGATRWWIKDFDEALPPLQAAVRLRPDHAEARYYLGLTLERHGRLEPAIDELREAVRLNPRLAVQGSGSLPRCRRSAISTPRSSTWTPPSGLPHRPPTRKTVWASRSRREVAVTKP